MKHVALLVTTSLMFIALLSPGYTLAAEPAKQDIVGQWRLKSTNPDGPPMNVILTIAKDKDGKLSGQWLSFFGPAVLKDIKFDNDKLTFVQTANFRGEEFVSDYSGTLVKGKLMGILYNDFGDMEMEGTLMQPKPAAAGVWEITTQRDEREMTSTLIIKADKDGKLLGTWKSQRGDSEISDVNFKDDKLTFKRKMTFQEREIEITYDLAVKGDTISGTSKTPRGESTLTGKRADPPVVGTWELTITTEQGERKQILIIDRDLTAMFGAEDVDKITIDGGKIEFKMSRAFGDRNFETEFKGTVEGDKLAGEMTNTFSQTPQKVVGKKI